MHYSNRIMPTGYCRLRPAIVICIALFGLLLTGCAEVNYLRDAQSAFSEAARLDNRLDPTGISSDGTIDPLSEPEIRAGYASAIASLDRLGSDQIRSLKSDRLWGVVLTLKAMSYWRLGDYDHMERIAEEAKAIEMETYPRDRALLLALPGLRRVDEAHAIVTAELDGQNDEKMKQDRLATVERLVQNASAYLSDARQSVSEKHSVRSYLIQAELAGYKNLLDGRDKFAAGALTPAEATEVKRLLIDLDCTFEHSAEDSELSVIRRRMVVDWQKRFGMVDDDVSCRD